MDMFEKTTFTGEDKTLAMDMIERDNELTFELLTELGQVTKLIFTSKPPDPKNEADLITSCLVAKAMNTCEGIICLCKAGCLGEAIVLLRVLLESAIIMCFIDKDSDNLKKYVYACKGEELKRLNTIIDHQEYFNVVYNEEDFQNIKNNHNQLKEEFAKEGLNPKAKKNIREWANAANMSEAYIIPYGLFSSEIHIDSMVLDKYIVKDEHGIAKQIVVGSFDLKDLRHVLFTCCDLLIKILFAYASIRKLDPTPLAIVQKHRDSFGPPLI